MSTPSPESADADITQYLNPRYWDGRMVGNGQYASNAELRTEKLSLKAACLVHWALTSYIENMHTLFPLEVKGQGEAFEPHDYQPGTVILARGEGLVADEIGRMSVPETLPSQPLPRQPDLLPYENVGRVCQSEDGHITYGTNLMWGVVTPTKKRQNGLYGLASTDVHYDGNHVRLGHAYPLPAPIEIGKSSLRLLSDGADFLERTTKVAICSQGTPKRRSRSFWVGGFSGRTLPGEA